VEDAVDFRLKIIAMPPGNPENRAGKALHSSIPASATFYAQPAFIT